MIEDEFRMEYNAALGSGGVILREDRGLIEVSGADRTDWLHNLVTNVIKTLSPGEGNYAFCINVKGRVVFDMNMLVRQDAIWLDVDRREIDKAMAWLDRYIITEDVGLRDRSSEQQRIAVIGPAATAVCSALQFGNLVPMAWLQHETRELDAASVTMVRHDFTGLIGAEFVVVGESRGAAIERIEHAAMQAGAVSITASVVDVLRIEAGLPASVADIDEDVIPPETGQVERGISYQKGCYLGQEVLERMRSRGGLARKLVGIRLDGATLPAKGAAILADGADVGRITSAGYSPALVSGMALGYVRVAKAGEGTQLVVQAGTGEIAARIVDLPVRG